MSTDATTSAAVAVDAIEALDAVEATDVVDQPDTPLKITVFLADQTRTTAPLHDTLGEHDLQIWTVNFDWEAVTLVRADELAYPELGGEWPPGDCTALDDRLELIDAVRKTATQVRESAPRLRYWVKFGYGTETLVPLTDLLADTKLAVYSVDFKRDMAVLVPADDVSYTGGDGQ